MASGVDVHFTLNQPQACVVGPTHTYLLLILVHTTIDNYDRRESNRETWTEYKSLDSSVVVLYSINENNMERRANSKHKLQTLRKENDLYHDIILTNFSHKDTFSSVIAPSTVWISKFCPHASHVLNIFDNSVVDLVKLVPFLQSIHSTSGSILMCDYLMPYEATIYDNNLPARDKGICSYSSFITTPSVMKTLTSIVLNNQDVLQDAWLSEICNFASIPIETGKNLFTGSRTKPSMLKDLMGGGYLDSDIMVANIRSPIPGRESILMRQAWLLIQAHHDKAKSQEQISFDSTSESGSGSIIKLAGILMLIDFSVIFFIFALIFCKRRLKSFFCMK